LLFVAMVPVLTQTPASAGTIQTLQAKAAELASQIDAAYAHLNVLDEAYDEAQTRVSELRTSIADQNHSIAGSEHRLAVDNTHLRSVAIDAYVNGAGSGFSVFFNGNQQQLPMQQAYLSAASGNLNIAVSNVRIDRHQLTVHKQELQKSEAAELTTVHQIASDVTEAQATNASLANALSQVKGQLAQAVAAQEKAQAAEAAAAAAAAKAAAAQPPPPPPPPPPINPTPPPVSTGGSGGAAVSAAESQLGVPYVWGGATPGVGFDCSGLTMWSWGQAGVSLAHGATDQYYEIAHVSMSDLQPGDLIFYGDSGYLFHVVMYVGSGPYGSDTVIQAEETGTNVMYSPIPPGAYGAGQP
jgi:cell wall-associated NlpC family hydrolase